MRTVHDYMDRAQARNPLLKSDRRLSLAVGKTETAASFWRTGRTWPSDETMIRLAVLAGVDPEEALIELNIWRAQSPETRDWYSRIAEKVRSSLAQVLIAGVTSALVASTSPAQGEQTPHESTLQVPPYTLCALNLLLVRLMRRISLYLQTTSRRLHQSFTQFVVVNPLISPIR